jgi:hypothetical protein
MSNKIKSAMLSLEEITVGHNVRPENEYGDMFALQQSVIEQGLHQPLVIWQETITEVGKKAKEIINHLLCGYRRVKVLKAIKEQDLPIYEIHFPQGIPCIVYTGLTKEEADVIKADDADSKHAPSSEYALQLAANVHFAQGKSEKTVMIRCMGLLKEPPATKAAKLVLLRIDREKALAANALGVVKVLDDQILEELFVCHRGRMQRLSHVYRCPPQVLACLHKAAVGTNPEGFEEMVLPMLKSEDPAKLWKAHEADCKIKDEVGRNKYTALCTGPAFKAAWDAIITRNKEADEKKATGEPNAKAMSAKDMTKQLTDNKWMSTIGQQITESHIDSKKTLPDLANLDFNAYMAEIVQRHDPVAWAEVVKNAKCLLKDISDADDAANGRVETVTKVDKATK